MLLLLFVLLSACHAEYESQDKVKTVIQQDQQDISTTNKHNVPPSLGSVHASNKAEYSQVCKKIPLDLRHYRASGCSQALEMIILLHPNLWADELHG